MSPFPIHRPRRLRENPAIRTLVRETDLSIQDLVYPLFVTHGKNIRKAVASMPGVFQLSVDQLSKEAREIESLKIPAVILFGIPETKDSLGSSGYGEKSVISQALKALKDSHPELLVICDVCLCEYTDHGHCGVVTERGGARWIDNDASLELLS